jgi:osmotically-inducible protein OsmY
VDVHDGVATLSGQVPEPDIDCVVDETKRTFGVREVVNNLQRCEEIKAPQQAEIPQAHAAS